MSDTPVTIASYYRVHWGHTEEFLELFRRNHWPILRDQLESGHDRHLVGGGDVVAPALAEDVGAQRAVGEEGGDVEHAVHALDLVEVLGEGLPVPRHALVQGGAGDVLDALHELDQPVAVLDARAGAKPTPQLPITTVVTPCQPDGETSGSQVTWPS